jgi:hypothetical protein
MKVQTSDLIGAQLDWAVAKCEGVSLESFMSAQDFAEHAYQYSTTWSHGGLIIERESIGLMRFETWVADPDGAFEQYGHTPLIAAMRCYVASKLGDEVEIPAGLL